MAELTSFEAYEPSSESFEAHYSRFVGADQSESLLYGSTHRNVDSVRKFLRTSPWLRTGLMGAGSVAATLVIGSALTNQANSQLHPPEYAEFPQPDILSDRPFQAASPTASSPAAIASLTPTLPERIDSVEVQATLTPFRDLLAEQLQQRSYRSPLLSLGPQVAIAQANRSALGQTNSVATADSGFANLPNSVPLANLSQLQPALTELPDGATSIQSPATEQAEMPSASTPVISGSLEFNEAIALSPFVPGSQVSVPERIEAERASVTPLLEVFQENSTTNAPMESTPAPSVGASKFLYPEVQIQPLTQEQASRIAQTGEVSFRIVRVSLQNYQQLWATLNMGEPSPAPVYGFVDRGQQIVLLPFGDRDENGSS
ncbi:MAG: hypothetical protein HC899_01085 [Leptolyngbyaceae cyanobacterium SM1_4_3]|nr:hypothetical protein [Leptolyngbyaceae cyanobacterium SM1_4_3]NJN92098.1 hypothetical protein [Leptolyngbyaceae cyanobacterium SL_5_14]